MKRRTASRVLGALLLARAVLCFREYHYTKLTTLQGLGLVVPNEGVLLSPERVLPWPAKQKTCFRMEGYSFNDIILIDESGGLEFYSVANANAPSLNENSKPFPATTIPKKHQRTVYACCNDCDPPYQTAARDTLVNLKYTELNGGLDVKTFGVYCSSGARGKEAPCVCTVPSTSSLMCPVGQYRYNCMINYLGSCTNCTNGAGETLQSVVYTSQGNPRRNDCAFQCAPGNYFDLAASKCMKCEVCRDGMYTVQPCSQATVRGEISLVRLPFPLSWLFFDVDEKRAQDTVCMKCPLGFTTRLSNNRLCDPCGFGKRAADDTVGCVSCTASQYTVSAPNPSPASAQHNLKKRADRTQTARPHAKTANPANRQTPQKTRACSVPLGNSAAKTCFSANCVLWARHSRNRARRCATSASTESRRKRARSTARGAGRGIIRTPQK
jgi:hypothetical protein